LRKTVSCIILAILLVSAFTLVFNIRSTKCFGPPAVPVAIFTVNPDPTYVGKATKFDGSASAPGWNGTMIVPITQYSWVFGDGNTTTITTPIIYHAYSKIGNYTATLTVMAPGSIVENSSQTPALVKVLAAPTDWPMFHHDLLHTGYSTSPAPTTNQTLWSYKTGGGVGSPAVVYGIVYVGSSDGNVYALNATTGALAWKYKTGGGVDSSPAASGGVVYVGSEDDNVYALNATTGALMWNYKTGGAVESSPAITGGLVYVGSDDENVYALNASTGALVWNYMTNGPVYSSPAVANSVVYVTATTPGQDGNAYALNASTGALVWNYTAPDYNGREGWMTNSPLVVGDVVFVIVWWELTVRWGSVFSLNASTGALIRSLGASGQIGQSDLAVAGDVVFIGTAPIAPAGPGYVLALNATTGALLWQYESDNSAFCSPSIAGDVILVGVDSSNCHVLALNASTGMLVWSRAVGPMASSPAIADGVVYVGSGDGNVYALGFNPIHSVAVTNAAPSKTVIGRSYGDIVNVTVANQGGFTETFNITLYANATSIASQNMTLPVGTSATTTLVWSTTGLAYGNYIISAKVTLMSGETNQWTGPLTYGTVKVTIPGDINGDGVVNARDLSILATNWLEKVPPAAANADINGDGVVNARDLSILAGNWLGHT